MLFAVEVETPKLELRDLVVLEGEVSLVIDPNDVFRTFDDVAEEVDDTGMVSCVCVYLKFKF